MNHRTVATTTKLTIEQARALTKTRRGLSQSEAIRQAIRAWVIAQGEHWPEHDFDTHGGDRKSIQYKQSKP